MFIHNENNTNIAKRTLRFNAFSTVIHIFTIFVIYLFTFLLSVVRLFTIRQNGTFSAKKLCTSRCAIPEALRFWDCG